MAHLASEEIADSEANQYHCVSVQSRNIVSESRYEHMGRAVKYNSRMWENVIKKSHEAANLVIVHEALNDVEYKALTTPKKKVTGVDDEEEVATKVVKKARKQV